MSRDCETIVVCPRVVLRRLSVLLRVAIMRSSFLLLLLRLFRLFRLWRLFLLFPLLNMAIFGSGTGTVLVPAILSRLLLGEK